MCMFCGCAGHLDEFCFHCKRIEKRRFDCARNSYCDEFFDFSPRSYSRALPHTSHALPHFSHGPNHLSYGFGSQENSFVPRHFGYGARTHHGDRFSYRPKFPDGGSYFQFEPRNMDGPRYPHRGSRPTSSKTDVQKTVKTLSGRKVQCWIPKIYLTNPSTEPSTSSNPMWVLDGGLENMWLIDSGCSRHMTGVTKWFSNLTPMLFVCLILVGICFVTFLSAWLIKWL
jgi:hypothetical protein